MTKCKDSITERYIPISDLLVLKRYRCLRTVEPQKQSCQSKMLTADSGTSTLLLKAKNTLSTKIIIRNYIILNP